MPGVRSFLHAPQNTHGTPLSYLLRNTAVRCFGGLPAAFASVDLLRVTGNLNSKEEDSRLRGLQRR